MSIALINIGDSHVGDLAGSRIPGDAVICDGGRISWIGNSRDVGEHDSWVVAEDAEGAGAHRSLEAVGVEVGHGQAVADEHVVELAQLQQAPDLLIELERR